VGAPGHAPVRKSYTPDREVPNVFVNPSAADMRAHLESVRTIAVLGLSNRPLRDSYGVARYLEEAGYKVVPVNPTIEMWEGHQSFPDLATAARAAEGVGRKIDLVVVFRRPSEVRRIVQELLKLKMPAAWFQLGVIDWDAARRAREHGMWVVMDHCIAVEHRKLLGAPVGV